MIELNGNSLIYNNTLATLSLFSGLNETEFNTIADALKPVHVKNGESIFKEGDAGKEMYIFVSGVMSAFAAQSDGTERKLFDVKLGNFFGEMSIITNEPRSVTITAMEDSVLIMIQEADFYRIIKDHPVIGFKILTAISVVQNQWLNYMSKSFTDLLRWGESARKRAITDELTGLYNRRFLEETIKERFSNPSMNLRIMSLLMMDLDKIHAINDRHGTKGGDLIIMGAADMISSCMRPGDIPARLSGDEFAVLLPDTDKKSAADVAERIRESIEKNLVDVPASPGSEEKVKIGTRTSIGISQAPMHANTLEMLMETADSAVMKAKELGRNRVELFG